MPSDNVCKISVLHWPSEFGAHQYSARIALQCINVERGCSCAPGWCHATGHEEGPTLFQPRKRAKHRIWFLASAAETVTIAECK